MVNWISENLELLLEITAVLFGVAYVILAAHKNVWCWLFGIIGSAISIYIFIVYSKLYAEALLYFYYVVAGILGWLHWKKGEASKTLDIVSKPIITHILVIVVGIILSYILYKIIATSFPEAQRPLFDSFTTIFSFIATWLTVKKWIENWLYWIIINLASVALYQSRGLEVYSYLMLFNAIMALYGYIRWREIKRRA
ncbi:MAG: nicotinamide riboside transporter PnuC [Bacteroidia bacterium]